MDQDDLDVIADTFAHEVPEIGAGTVEVMAIARRRGYRTKLAVRSHDPRVDCIAACVGVRGHRIKNIVDALGGERVELIRWTELPEQLIANSLRPATIERVVLLPAEHRAVVSIESEQVSLVQGRRGENLKLASELTGWRIEFEVINT